MKDWIIQNWEILAGAVMALIIGWITLTCIGKFCRRKAKKQDSIASDIHEKRSQLREIDKLLLDLQNYFVRVEKKLDMSHIKGS